MAVQNSVALRNAILDAWEAAIGTTPKVQIRTGSQPANCAAAASGTLLCEMDLPSDWMNAASGGSKTKLGTWADVGVAAGSAGHYRILDAAGTTCHEHGSVTATGGGGDMTVDNVSIAVDQVVTVTGFTKGAGNA